MSPRYRLRQRSMSSAQITAMLAKQRERDKLQKQQQRVRDVLAKFRPKKSERGKAVFIGVDGKRSAAQKGRRGYLVYVSSTGRKSAVRQHDTGGHIERVATAKKLRHIDANAIRSKKARKEFLRSQLTTRKQSFISQVGIYKVEKGRPTLDKKAANFSGRTESPYWSRDSKAVKRITADLVKALKNQVSRKNFQVTVMFLIDGPDGMFTVTTTQRFSKPDKYKVDRGHIESFLLRQVYAFLARELESRGYVTTGSAKHVARLKENEGKERDEWTKNGEEWKSAGLQDVEVLAIEYRIDYVDIRTGI